MDDAMDDAMLREICDVGSGGGEPADVVRSHLCGRGGGAAVSAIPVNSSKGPKTNQRAVRAISATLWVENEEESADVDQILDCLIGLTVADCEDEARDLFSRLMAQLVLAFYIVTPVDIECPENCFPMLVWDDSFRDKLIKQDAFSIVLADNWAIVNRIHQYGEWAIDSESDVSLCYFIKAAYELLAVLYRYVENKLEIEVETLFSGDNFLFVMALGEEHRKTPSRELLTDHPEERYFFDLPEEFFEWGDRLAVFTKLLDINNGILKTIFEAKREELLLSWRKESAHMRVARISCVMASRGLSCEEIVCSIRGILNRKYCKFKQLFENLKLSSLIKIALKVSYDFE